MMTSVTQAERPAPGSYDKLCAAISILQAAILADDTTLEPKSIFGQTFFMPRAGLEMAERLLVEVLEDM